MTQDSEAQEGKQFWDVKPTSQGNGLVDFEELLGGCFHFEF